MRFDFEVTNMPDFMGDAALPCRDNPAAFTPENPTLDNTREVRRQCGKCAVKAECLQWALDHDEPTGVWGGMTPGQRHDLKRQLPLRVVRAA